MRIGFIVSGGFDRSGQQRVTPSLLWLVERLARRHDVHVFVLHYYPEPCRYSLLGATVHDIGRVEGLPGVRRGRQRRRLSAAIGAQGRFDLLHAYQGIPAIAAASIASRLGVPMVVTLDSGELASIDDIGYGLQRRWFDRAALASAIRSAARVTVSTNFMARMIPAELRGAPAVVIPIGIDTGIFPLARPADGPPWRLLRIASLNKVKDYPTLIQALALVIARGLEVHLDIVGEDTLDGATQRLTQEMRLESRLTFHGFQPTDRIAAFYARAHLHLVTSRHEAAGVTVLEAAAAGVPTVGTSVGYVADWDPDRAVAVPVRNPEALAHAIVEVLQDPERRAKLAAAAREWTLAHDADWTSAQFEQLYDEVATVRLKPDTTENSL
jgi:glycosyltransferase involved in cell wall biosynthesis